MYAFAVKIKTDNSHGSTSTRGEQEKRRGGGGGDEENVVTRRNTFKFSKAWLNDLWHVFYFDEDCSKINGKPYLIRKGKFEKIPTTLYTLTSPFHSAKSYQIINQQIAAYMHLVAKTSGICYLLPNCIGDLLMGSASMSFICTYMALTI